MHNLLIVYHSQSGACAKLARAASDGASREDGVPVNVLRAWDAATADLADSAGLLLVAAENSGTLCGAMKDFLDRSFYPAIARGLVLPYGCIVSAGNDGRGAVSQAQRILSGYPFPPAMEPVIMRGEVTPGQLADSADVGQAFAAGLAMGIF